MKLKLLPGVFILLLSNTAIALPGSGVYVMENVIVQNVPSSKPDGAAWDPMGGAPDLYIRFLIAYPNERSGGNIRTELQSETTTRENCYSAIWTNVHSFFLSELNVDRDDVELLIEVWDSDTYRDDFIDSGNFSLKDMSTGSVDFHLRFGTQVSFDLSGPFID